MANHRLTEPDAEPGPEPPPVYFKEWREANGLTQRQVERMYGWSKGKLSRLEKGAKPWEPHTLAILARTYNCTIGDLVSRLPPATTAPRLAAAPEADTYDDRQCRSRFYRHRRNATSDRPLKGRARRRCARRSCRASTRSSAASPKPAEYRTKRCATPRNWPRYLPAMRS